MAREVLEIGICGSGPKWAGVEEKLRQQEGLRVRRLGDSLAAAVPEIVMLSPHAVLFEIGNAEPTAIAAIMQRLTGTKLIGLSAAGTAITVFAASARPVLSAEELTRVITDDHAPCAADERSDTHAKR